MSESFKTSARVVLEIGRDSIESKIVALSEIIKNSYDANAKNCIITLFADGKQKNLLDKEISLIEIFDDGHGMSKEDLINKWMVIGTSTKKENKVHIENGRIPIGEKGIGRFAVNKIGNLLTLITKRENECCYQLVIDFDRFESDDNLDNIHFTIDEVSNAQLEKLGHGTILRIQNLNDDWNADEISKVYDEILKLQSPFKNTDDQFEVIFNLPDGYVLKHKLKPQDVLNKSLWNASIVIDPNNETDVMNFEFTPYIEMKGFTKISYPVNFDHFIYSKKKPEKIEINKYNIGKISVKLYAFHRSTKVLSMLKDMRKSIKEYLDENGGIRIYRGGQRIYNYGTKNEDWLDLNLKRLNSPGTKLSKNILIGVIDLEPLESSDLKEKTNREGFIENDAFFEFKKIISAVVDKFAFEMIPTKNKIKEVFDKNVKIETIDNTFEELLSEIEDADFTNQNEKDKVIEITNKTITEYQESKKLYLSITNNSVDFHMVFHDVDKQVKSLVNLVSKEEINVGELKNTIYNINDILSMQKDLISNRDFKIIKTDNLLKKFDIYSKYRIKDHGIELQIVNEGFEFKCIESQILRVLMNMLDNSIYWLDVKTDEKKVFIKFCIEDGKKVIYFADNGPGLGVEDTSIIFKPFVTKKDGGLGLGLYIVNEIVSVHNGKIEVLDDYNNEYDSYCGAKFRIELN